jgi:hypothetical protein
LWKRGGIVKKQGCIKHKVGLVKYTKNNECKNYTGGNKIAWCFDIRGFVNCQLLLPVVLFYKALLLFNIATHAHHRFKGI